MKKIMICSMLFTVLLAGCAKPASVDSADDPSSLMTSQEEKAGMVTEVFGPYGKLSLSIPEGWSVQELPVDSGALLSGDYGMALKPDTEEKSVQLVVSSAFGICGTGVRNETIELADGKAQILTYVGDPAFSFLVFETQEDPGLTLAVVNPCLEWTNTYREELLAILDTMEFDSAQAKGEIGTNGKDMELYEQGVNVQVSNVSETRCRLTANRFEGQDPIPLCIAKEFSLEVFNGGEYTAVENGVFASKQEIELAEGACSCWLDWGECAGSLGKGDYRIAVTVIGEGFRETIYAYFILR